MSRLASHRPSNTPRAAHIGADCSHPLWPVGTLHNAPAYQSTRPSVASSFLPRGRFAPFGSIRQALCKVPTTAGSAATDAPPPLVPRCWHRCPSALSVRERQVLNGPLRGIRTATIDTARASRSAPTTPPTTTNDHEATPTRTIQG